MPCYAAVQPLFSDTAYKRKFCIFRTLLSHSNEVCRNYALTAIKATTKLVRKQTLFASEVILYKAYINIYKFVYL